MTLENILKFIFDLVIKLMSLELPIGEYRVSFWQLFVFTAIVILLLKLVFGLGGGKNDG